MSARCDLGMLSPPPPPPTLTSSSLKAHSTALARRPSVLHLLPFISIQPSLRHRGLGMESGRSGPSRASHLIMQFIRKPARPLLPGLRPAMGIAGG